MSKDHIRSFSTKRREFTIRILSEKFQSDERNRTSERAKSDRKFNIRIKQDDISLLEALAKKGGVTRSALINDILHDIMRDELMSIEDQDARVLLAHVADLSASYDDLTQPWVYDALGFEFRHMLESVLQYSNTHGQPPEVGLPSGYQISDEDYRSPAYMGLRDKLKGVSR